MKRTVFTTLAVLVVALTSACGRGISGTYQDPDGVASYEFQSGNRVLTNVMGTTLAAEYKVEGDRIFVSSAQGTLVFSRNKETNTLVGPMGLVLRKVRD